MLIIQHIWTQWTKRSRGADTAMTRPRLEEAYSVPPAEGEFSVFYHELRAMEREDFRIIESFGEITRDGFERAQPYRQTALDWRLWGKEAHIIVRRPSRYTQQTKWPAHLPSPLFVLKQGETARIDWNGRFRSSLFGSNRSSYYEQHRYWLAVAAAPEPLMFLDAEPKKKIDFTTEIY